MNITTSRLQHILFTHFDLIIIVCVGSSLIVPHIFFSPLSRLSFRY